MYGDPQRLYALAAKVEARERELRTQALRLRNAARETRWFSLAGDTHRARLEADLADVDRCADNLREAADALRAHAAQVERTLALIAQAEREVRAWFSAAQRSVTDRLSQAVNAVGDFFDDITPWDGWRWTPVNLPVPGSLDWLDAAKLVKGAPWRP